MIWISSFPGARSIRVRLVLDEALSWIYHNGKSPEVLDVKFSYEESDPLEGWPLERLLSTIKH
jgi:hypothetical protein